MEVAKMDAGQHSVLDEARPAAEAAPEQPKKDNHDHPPSNMPPPAQRAPPRQQGQYSHMLESPVLLPVMPVSVQRH